MPGKYTWADERRKGATCQITDSVGRMAHARKAMGLEPPLAKPVPLPAETVGYLEFARAVNVEEVTNFWITQLTKLREVAQAAAQTQLQWQACIAGNLGGRPPSLLSAALLRLTQCFGLGGGRWIRQFTPGFTIVGTIGQTGVFPRDDSAHPPPDPRGIWTDNHKRYTTRARASGSLMPWLFGARLRPKLRRGGYPPIDP